MKLNRTKIRYEVFNYEGPAAGFGFKSYTLVFKNPASVSFYNYGGTSIPGTINNAIILSPYIDVLSGIATTDYKYQFINAVNEVDTTIWTLKLFAGVIFQVVVKFYVDEE